ncbi:MAG TPA: DUF2339 domain-containing protein [Candidatus Ozemobacteraceae bacterium]|mgnify:CR=1 FL=1|nr:DUF2339 domain-containing protein [Candidatus Ozemobacteraceae bacterium]
MEGFLFLLVVGLLLYIIRSGQAQSGGDKPDAQEELKLRIIRLERRLERVNERLDIFSSELWSLKKNLSAPPAQAPDRLPAEEPDLEPPPTPREAVSATPPRVPEPAAAPVVATPSWKDALVEPLSPPGEVIPLAPPEPLPLTPIEQSSPIQPHEPLPPLPPLPVEPPPTAEEVTHESTRSTIDHSRAAMFHSDEPAPTDAAPPRRDESRPASAESGSIDWENFLGKKLFAWIGSFALFLSALFFVRYAIENDLVSLGMRLVLGFLVGSGSIAGGLWLKRYGYRQTVDGLCAAGLAILYAVFVAAHRLPAGDPYLGTAATFSLLTALTAGAFTLSVRLDSLFVAILAMVGGFLVPPFVSTGQDNPLGLFAYVTLLDAGLLAVALRKRWGVLITLSAVGTMLMQAGWVMKFFGAAKFQAAWLIFAWFPLFFTVARHLAAKRDWSDPHVENTARVVPLLSMWIVPLMTSTVTPVSIEDIAATGSLLRTLSEPAPAPIPLAVSHGGMIMALPYWLSALVGWQAYREAAASMFAKYAHILVFLLTWGWTGSGFRTDTAGTGWLLFAAYPAFFFALWRLTLRTRDDAELSGSARWSGLLGFTFNAYQLLHNDLGNDPAHVFSLTALLAVGLAWQAMKDESASPFHFGGGISAFTVIAIWASSYAVRDHTTAAYLAFLGFPLFFAGTSRLAALRGRLDATLKAGGRVFPLAGMVFASMLAGWEAYGSSPGLAFSLVLVIDLLLAWEARSDREAAPYHTYGCWATFAVLWIWGHQFGSAETAMTGSAAFFGFTVFYAAAWRIVRRLDGEADHLAYPARLAPLVSMTWVAWMLTEPALAAQPAKVLGLLFLLDLILTWQTIEDDGARPWHMGASIAGFALLMTWTTTALTEALLPVALGFYLLFGALHALLPIVLQRLRPSGEAYNWMHLYPALMLLVMIAPILNHTAAWPLMMPVIFLLNLVGLVASWLSSAMWIGIVMLTVTTGCFGAWIFTMKEVTELPGFLGVQGFFAVAFHIWAHISFPKQGEKSLCAGTPAWLKRVREVAFGPQPEGETEAGTSLDIALLPSLSAFLPFILLTMVVLVIRSMPDPSMVFGLMLLLAVMLLRLTHLLAVDGPAIVALMSTAMVQLCWQTQHYQGENWLLLTAWHAAIFALFFGFPLLYRERMQNRTLPWIAAAAAGPIQFFLLYQTLTTVHGKAWIGALPVLFAAPFLYAMKELVRKLPEELPGRLSILAWFGGTALFFITLAFPLQLDQEWLTIGWALEGAALCWLFLRIPHPGLRLWGIALLVTAFARLALNPEVLEYHSRSGIPVLNWYLYAYGLVTACLIAGGIYLAPPRNRLFGYDVPKWLFSFATILAFLLVNIEVADAFSQGARIDFQLKLSRGQDLTYSLAWAAFSFVLLIVGIWTKRRGARIASIGLMAVTIVKVFLYDLIDLGGLYRVVSLLGLAVALMMVSFLYQKFLSTPDDAGPSGRAGEAADDPKKEMSE